MAPVSMEVCINILSGMISTSTSKDDNEYHLRQQKRRQLAALVLLGHWLPVAPHLTTMAREYLIGLDNPWQDLISTTTIQSNHTADQLILFTLMEAVFQLCTFFQNRGEISTLRRLHWDWTLVFAMLPQNSPENIGDTTMVDVCSENDITYQVPNAIQWYSARILCILMNWTSAVAHTVLEKRNLSNDRVQWIIHPWEINQEEVDMERSFLTRQAVLWEKSNTFFLPTSETVQSVMKSTSPYLTTVGSGIAFYKQKSLQSHQKNQFKNLNNTSVCGHDHLVPTTTTCRNLCLLGAAMCQELQPPPILVCGPHGSGKSSLIRELLKLCRPAESLVEFHIDEETDSKTLIGAYTTSDIPGEFAWRAGALTQASREGRWVLIEDLDSVPVEIQAALIKLLEERILPLGNGKYESCHPDFRIFATCTTNFSSLPSSVDRRSLRIGNQRGSGKQILNPSYWGKVHVKPLPYSELNEVSRLLHPDLPQSVIDSAMSLLRALDQSGRSNSSEQSFVDATELTNAKITTVWTGGRIPSVRDLFKLLSRISHSICFEKNTAYITEAQRTLCMAESVDIFVGSCPHREVKEEYIALVAAPAWGITRDLALRYMETREPTITSDGTFFEIGRAKIEVVASLGFSTDTNSSSTFAHTSHVLRLMESLAVCVRENEPALLCGETGTGKTTAIQQLASHCERTLVVQNLSLQTDSTDLLGGYRPLEIQNIARHVYNDFVDTFVSSFSRKQNAKFLQYAAAMLEKASWKKLSQCFQRASQLGLAKMSERSENEKMPFSDSMMENWTNFAKKAERFERQRVSCDAGLAFEFSEGALVDAIQSGKW